MQTKRRQKPLDKNYLTPVIIRQIQTKSFQTINEVIFGQFESIFPIKFQLDKVLVKKERPWVFFGDKDCQKINFQIKYYEKAHLKIYILSLQTNKTLKSKKKTDHNS